MNTLLAAPPSFESPVEMLQACHDKVRHFAALAPKLARHLQDKGLDQQARDAAQAILRYFDLAAPLHHADEDEDLYPALIALDDEALNTHIKQVSAEHADLGQLWQAMRPWLLDISMGLPHPAPAAVAAFAHQYPAHAQAEESLIYPSATRLNGPTMAAISQKMQKRRQST